MRESAKQALLIRFPFCSGGTLKTWALGRRDADPLPCALALQLFHAVQALEQARIVHTDVKEANCFLHPSHAAMTLCWQFKVAPGDALLVLGDFGWACRVGDPCLSDEEQTFYGELLGTCCDTLATWRLWHRLGIPEGAARRVPTELCPASNALQALCQCLTDVSLFASST